jgi:transketolase
LGEEEIKLTKKAYGWPEDKKFFVPDEVQKLFRDCIVAHGQKANADWNALFTEYKKQYAEQAGEIEHIVHGDLPAGWDAEMQPFPADAKGMASRVSSGKVLNQIAKHVPWLIGGSADLAPSNNTLLNFEKVGDFSASNYAGRNLHFGIREHAMGSIINGMVLSGLRAYGATFFVFSDYMRPPIRLAALMGLPVIYVFTHDSIGVGEDGPTHQPVEHLAALRAIPHLLVVRPADANEVSEAYKIAMIEKQRPTALVLTRQNLPTFDRTKVAPADGVRKGGYILADAADGKPDVILIATGSEVSLCLTAYEKLTAEGVKARVVSIPCWELFDEQPAEYRDAVLPPTVPGRVGVELGIKQGWEKYIGPSGKFIGMNGFGASAPFEVVLKHFGVTVENIVAAAKEQSIRQKN